MTLINSRINTIVNLGESLSQELNKFYSDSESRLGGVIRKANAENPWFTPENILYAIQNWILSLMPESVDKWSAKYNKALEKTSKELDISVVNAGNIPFVGLHDLLCVLLSGHKYSGKNATGDSVLLPFISDLIVESDPSLRDRIRFIPKIEKPDAVIATGNNNSSRYFEYYFGKYPHVIRKNRNGVGVLSNNESKEQLRLLGKDIFTYFGLGCRNVSKLYVPRNYSFNNFFESIEEFNDARLHNKYMNNFEYNNSVFLLKQIPFLQNGFLIVRKEKQIASPVSVLHYEEYDDERLLINSLERDFEQLQCIVSGKNIFRNTEKLENISVDFGMTQSPALWDYADGIDTVKFLTEL